MNETLEQFLTMPMIVYCLVIWCLVWAQRKGIEMAFPKLKNAKVWRELLVPVAPLGVGALLAIPLSMYPFPESFANHWTGRAAVGLVCGLGSGVVYRLAKKWILDKLPLKSNKDSDTSDSGAPPTT